MSPKSSVAEPEPEPVGAGTFLVGAGAGVKMWRQKHVIYYFLAYFYMKRSRWKKSTWSRSRSKVDWLRNTAQKDELYNVSLYLHRLNKYRQIG